MTTALDSAPAPPRDSGRGARAQGSPAPTQSRLPLEPADSSDPGRLRQALMQAGQFRAALLSAVADPVFELRRDGLVLSFQAPADNEFGLTAETVVGRRVMQLLPTQLGQLALHYIEKVLRTGAAQRFCCQFMAHGRLRYFETRLAAGVDGTALAVVRDVTDRETLEREVVESSSRVQMRIGQDIHDGLGQHLTGISFLSRALEKKLAALNLPEAAEAAEISKLVLETLAQTRNLARGLFPVEIESDNLVASLKELASSAEQLFDISCSVECEAGIVVSGQMVSTHLFRLAQEAINNAVKHGKAQRIAVTLRRDGDRFALCIADDGQGLPATGASRTGLGLRIMNYRAQKAGGTLDIRAGETGGAVVTCTFTSTTDEN